jgi:hypothetical protein
MWTNGKKRNISYFFATWLKSKGTLPMSLYLTSMRLRTAHRVNERRWDAKIEKFNTKKRNLISNSMCSVWSMDTKKHILNLLRYPFKFWKTISTKIFKTFYEVRSCAFTSKFNTSYKVLQVNAGCSSKILHTNSFNFKGIVSRDFVVWFLVSFDRSDISTHQEWVLLLLKVRFRIEFFDFCVRP